MKKYPVYKQLDLVQIAQEIHDFWQTHGTFATSIEYRAGRPTFNFYEGPPSANGEPGIHHILSRTLKDIFCRYKTLQGYQVQRKSGWDTHGLPVELQVEKSLGIKKEEIGKKISIASYNAHCRQTVMRYKSTWEKLTAQLGYWVDIEHPYITFEVDYIESLWYLLHQFYRKGLLYKGYSIQPYSPAAGTGLSSHELNQPGCYKLVKDLTVVAQFKLKKKENTYLLAWTTTPWTLPANSALAVGENIQYVQVKTYNPYTHQLVEVILAEAALPRYFTHPADSQAVQSYKPGNKPIPWEITAHYRGDDLIGESYEQILPYVQPTGPAFQVVAGDFVNTEEGTGIVHIAPTFGSDDMRLAQKLNIPAITVVRDNKTVPIVDKQGRFVEEITHWAGQYVKEGYEPEDIRNQPDYKSVDVLIATKLKQENKAFHVAKYEHTYPHCWRTDKPILYYPLDAWFIRTTAYKEQLIKLNKTITWKPASTGTGRFENWLENLVDWNLSRDRFWGTPLPIWQTEDQQEEICIGSLQALREEVAKSVAAGFMQEPLPADLDLHRPHVDNIILVSKSGKKMYRVPDLVDVWFDSGAMPYAQWHYPFKNQSLFQQQFPADFIAEGVDQTRGWFFTLHTIAVMLFDSVAFKHVISNGLILDKHGNKMSKRLGNSIDPFQIIEQYGPDALRWYMISNASPWDNLKFDPEGLVEVIRKFFLTLYNTYSFFALYANLDGFKASDKSMPVGARPEIDQWILSKLNSLIQLVTTELDAYEPTKACRAIQDFVVEDLSNWYVRLNRKRFWKSEPSPDKTAAYQTLYTCLVTIAQLASPFAPFYADRLYKDLQLLSDKALSVHLSDFPQADTMAIDSALEAKMQQAQTIVYLVHSLRKKHNIKVRQPLSKLIIPVTDKKIQAQIEAVADLVLAETNIKQIAYMDNQNELITKKVKPNFKQLGKRYRVQLNGIAAALSQLDPAKIHAFEQEGILTLQIENELIQLSLEDVQIVSEDISGWSVASHEGITVAMDITLTDELREEGIARDIVNRVQNMRKSIDLAIQDKILLTIATTEVFVQKALTAHQGYICQETQALQLDVVPALSIGEEVAIDNYLLKIQVTLQKGKMVE